MCPHSPKVVAIDGDKATIDVSGMKKDISLALMDDVAIGDYVISARRLCADEARPRRRPRRRWRCSRNGRAGHA